VVAIHNTLRRWLEHIEFTFSLVVIASLLFDFSETGEILRLQHNSQAVLVSYQEVGI